MSRYEICPDSPWATTAIGQTALLTCPVCDTALRLTGKALRCDRGHSFDIAREGYVNLLLKQRPGDTKEMLLARRRFLAQEHYYALSDAINQRIARFLSAHAWQTPTSSTPCILDVGCGEGYYLGRAQAALAARFADRFGCYLGVDISKDAVRMAAKRYQQCRFFTGDIHHKLQLSPNAVHTLLNVFAPRNSTEFARVVAPDGLLIIVIPSQHHLRELRTILPLIGVEAGKQARVIAQLTPAFTMVETKTIEYPISLNSDDLVNLITMTPNYWHVVNPARVAAQIGGPVQTTAGFTLLSFLRRANQ